MYLFFIIIVPPLKDILNVTDGHHMVKAPGGRECICVNLLDIGQTLILCWSAYTACVLLPMVGRTVAILGS